MADAILLALEALNAAVRDLEDRVDALENPPGDDVRDIVRELENRLDDLER